jgi:endonuclease/exonuclease/phosphatase family metal-dependent hydrolase
MKIFKNILKVLAILLVLILFVLLFYVPKYLIDRRTVTPAETVGEEITIMSTNVRFYNPLDFLKKSWFYRADLIAEDVERVRPDIVGFQEATFLHYDYLKSTLSGYDSEMSYRDDFILSEGCPIFWRTDRFEKIDSGSFWLSETPEVMSKDWGSSHYRICVYVILRDKTTNKEFAVFNTHLDNVSDEARINGIKVVLDKISEFGDLPSFLFGDMNATDDSETILSTRDSFDDAKVISPITEDTRTFHGWGDPTEQDRIDYILISKGDAEVYEYHVLDNCYDGVYSSDHSSIYIKTRIK